MPKAVRVIRQGLKSTGHVGLVVEETENHVRAQFEQFGILTLNKRSVEFFDLPEPAEAPKENKVAKKVRQLAFPPRENGVVVFYKDENNNLVINHARHFKVDVEGNELFGPDGLNIKEDKYLGFKQIRGVHAEFIKPAVDEFPFFINGMEGHQQIRDVARDQGINLFRAHNGMDYNPKWLAPAFLDKLHKWEEVEVFDFEDKEALMAGILAATKIKAADNMNRGLCFGVVLLDNKGGIKILNQTGAACHWAMRSIVEDDRSNVPYAVQYITDKHYMHLNKKKWDTVDNYLTWVMNDSPWSQYILTKTVAEGKEHGVLIDAGIPANALMCTLYALRYPTEYPKKITDWEKYCGMGATPTMAFFLAETGGCARNTASHHQLLDTFYMTKDCLVRFLKHEQGAFKDRIYNRAYFNYKDVSRHHGVANKEQKPSANETAVVMLQEEFPPLKEEFDHPVLGKQEREIPAIQRIIDWSNEVLEK